MSSNGEEIPVAAVAEEDEADRAQPVSVKLSQVTMIAWKRDFGGKAYYFPFYICVL